MSKDKRSEREQSGKGEHMKKFTQKIDKERRRLKKKDKNKQ